MSHNATQPAPRECHSTNGARSQTADAAIEQSAIKTVMPERYFAGVKNGNPKSMPSRCMVFVSLQ